MTIHVKQIMSKDIAKYNDPADREQNQVWLIERHQPFFLLVQVIIHIEEPQRSEQWIPQIEPCIGYPNHRHANPRRLPVHKKGHHFHQAAAEADDQQCGQQSGVGIIAPAIHVADVENAQCQKNAYAVRNHDR